MAFPVRRRVVWAAACAAASAAVCCGGAPAAAAAPVRGGAPTYTNPVVPAEDAPDPGVVFCPESGLWLATTTTGGLPAFRARTSPDLATWTDAGYLFPSGLPWAGTDGWWAPEVHPVPGGGYNVYFVARNKATGTLSVGVAASASGNCTGPFVDVRGGPLVTDAAMGQIDPTHFTDADGTQYLIWKTDGNAVGQPTPIRYARLAANGTALAPGGPDWRTTALITDDQPWEAGITEAPWVVPHAGAYYLFYSGSGYTSNYAVGVAVAPAVTGPYAKRGPPILHQAPGGGPPFESPGHCSVVRAADGTWAMVYHAWLGAERNFRALLLDAVTWAAGPDGAVWPAVGVNGTPSTAAQPVP